MKIVPSDSIVRLIYATPLATSFSTILRISHSRKIKSILKNSLGGREKGNREKKVREEEDKSDRVNRNWKFYHSFRYCKLCLD